MVPVGYHIIARQLTRAVAPKKRKRDVGRGVWTKGSDRLLAHQHVADVGFVVGEGAEEDPVGGGVGGGELR